MTPTSRLRAASAALAIAGLAVSTLGATASSAATRKSQIAGSEFNPGGNPTCGGEVAYDADGTPMTCTFDDEFDAATGDVDALDTTKWVPQLTATSGYTTGGLGARPCYVNDPSTISVSDGSLKLSITKANSQFTCASLGMSFGTKYSAGMVSSYNLFAQTYGQFEVRAKIPASKARGLQETFWLYPENHQYYGASPASGEIDFAEFYSQYPTNDIPYIHYKYTKSTAQGTTNKVTSSNCFINYGAYNTYGAIWKPGEITTLVNGQVCFTDDYVPNNGLVSPEPFDQPFFIALTQAIGVNTNAPTTQTMTPATTSIDYVRAWK